jgi:hypothetical protein
MRLKVGVCGNDIVVLGVEKKAVAMLQVDRLVGQHVAWLLSVNKYSINILIFEKFFDYCENDKFLVPYFLN